MINLENLKTLNDGTMVLYGKINYYNRERFKKYLNKYGIDWKEWLAEKKHKEPRYCLNCGKELTGRDTVKFCSSSCSASYNNKLRGSMPEDVKEKISYALSSKSPDFNNETYEYYQKTETICVICGKTFTKMAKDNMDCCSNTCRGKYKFNEFVKNWKDGKESGIVGSYGISARLKHYLLEKYNYSCSKCGWSERNPYTNRIPLEVEHIDGNFQNNSEENLTILCPNCHSLTSTYKGANRGHGRKARKKYDASLAQLVEQCPRKA